MLRNELEKELVQVHAKLRNELCDILTMINLIGDDFGIITSNRSFLNKPVSDFYTDYAFDDCRIIKEEYPIINEKALAIEKEFLEKFFSEYEDIQPVWLLNEYITEHILIYSAILFKTVVHFNAFNIYFIEKFLELYPYKYKYHLEYGNDLLKLSDGVLRGINSNTELIRQYCYVFTGTKIVKTKWYILREYHRHLIGEDSSDMNYMENVFPLGISTKQEAINKIQNMAYFKPHHNYINNCFLTTAEYIEFF